MLASVGRAFFPMEGAEDEKAKQQGDEQNEA